MVSIRKGVHWFFYLIAMLRAAILILVVFLGLGFAINEGFVSPEYVDLVRMASLLVYAYVAWVLMIRLVSYACIKCVVDNHGVMFKGGFLPWRKWQSCWNYGQVFSSNYTHDFLGWLLGYGRVTIVSREGAAERNWVDKIGGAKQLSAFVNQRVNERERLNADALARGLRD